MHILCGWRRRRYAAVLLGAHARPLPALTPFCGVAAALTSARTRAPAPQVTAFWQFFLLRMLTGVAVGGVIPIAFSLLGDMFPASQRNAVVAMAQMAMGAGVCFGQVRAAAAGCILRSPVVSGDQAAAAALAQSWHPPPLGTGWSTGLAGLR